MGNQISIPGWGRRFAALMDEAEREGNFWDKEVIAHRLEWWASEFEKQAFLQRLDYEEDCRLRNQ